MKIKSLFEDVNVVSVIASAERAITHALTLEQDRTGGYFCLADLDGIPLFLCKIGDVLNRERGEKYFCNAKEKCRRLGTSGYTLASESRDYAKEKYAGAVKGSNYIYGFSGLPEYLDEAAMLVCASWDCDIEREDAKRLAKKSQNPYWDRMVHFL